jgi:hypothetical protein
MLEDALFFCKGAISHEHAKRGFMETLPPFLRRQLLSPLVSPPLQDILSGFGTHALKEAVSSFPF